MSFRRGQLDAGFPEGRPESRRNPGVAEFRPLARTSGRLDVRARPGAGTSRPGNGVPSRLGSAESALRSGEVKPATVTLA